MKSPLKFLSSKPLLFAVAFWFLSLIIVAAAINYIVLPIIAGHLVSTLEVPNVVGLSAEEAEETLGKSGLNVKWAKEGRYSSAIPANHTLIQIPAAGRTVKERRTIFLTLSKGKQEVEIPNLRGQSQRQAEISLQRLGLILGKKIEGAHAEIPRGVVIRTEPEAEKKVRVGTEIALVISSGNSVGKTLLQNLKDLSLERAKTVIDSLGFEVGEISHLAIDNKLPNTVLEQSPKSGEYFEPGTKINLTVAE